MTLRFASFALLLCMGLPACEPSGSASAGSPSAGSPDASQAAPSQAGPSQAMPSQAGPSQAAVEPPARLVHARADGQLGPGRGTLLVDLVPEPGSKLSEGSPLQVQARGQDLSFPEAIRTELSRARLPLRLPVVVSDGAAGPAELTLSYYTCRSGPDAVCRRERSRIVVELDLSGSAEGGEAHLVHHAGS
ncbi:MAG TPA: hypothetical protein VLC09_07885 [Polyangiaceae bacterium]|nr:hypothetical protein [Polyangiaceae bacterium]